MSEENKIESDEPWREKEAITMDSLKLWDRLKEFSESQKYKKNLLEEEIA